MKPEIKNALSVDFEDWYNGMLQIKQEDWHLYENRLGKSLGRITELFDRYNVKATFFVLGYVAEKFPALVKMIAEKGHEIASHGYDHRPVFTMAPGEFREDALRAKKIIEEVSGVKVSGYRAPFFSIRKDTLWALDILKETGFRYDSSIFPTKNFLYGIPDAPHTIYSIKSSGLIEFPLSVVKKCGVTIPVCGGFYMRALPYKVIKWGISYFNRTKGPAVIYLHPWELDKDKPKIKMKLKWKIIHEYNIRSMDKKIERLVKDFRFTTISKVLFNE